MSAEDNLEQIEAARQAAELRTVEKQSEYEAALEHEKEGYEARLARLSDGKPDQASRTELEQLVAGVDAELARVTGRPKKARSKKEAAGK